MDLVTLQLVVKSQTNADKQVGDMGGSPGLVVKGGDSKTEGCEFEYWMDIFSH